MIEKVNTYISNPLCCYNCQKLGHHESWYTKKRICKKCREDGSNLPESACKQFKSTAMEITQLTQDYAAWKREKETLKIKYTQDIPFPEAKKIVETTLSAWSYSGITQSIQNSSTQNTINAVS